MSKEILETTRTTGLIQRLPFTPLVLRRRLVLCARHAVDLRTHSYQKRLIRIEKQTTVDKQRRL